MRYEFRLPVSANKLVKPVPIRTKSGAIKYRLSKTKADKVWRVALQLYLKTQRPPRLHGPLKLTATFVVNTIASDGSNRLKALEDALKGIVLHDDCQVTSWAIRKAVCQPGEAEHVEFEVKEDEGCDVETRRRLLASKRASGR